MSSFFDDFSLKKEDFSDIEPTYLIPGFLPKTRTVVVYAPPGEGKGWFAHALSANFNQGKVSKAIYLDQDTNSNTSSIRERGIDRLLIERFPSSLAYLHHSKVQANIIRRLMKNSPEEFTDALVIVDVHDSFASSRDEDQIFAFARLCAGITNFGATVIVLHHANKSGAGYKGEGAIKGAYQGMNRLIKRDESSSKITLALEMEKAAGGSVGDIGIRIDKETLAMDVMPATSVFLSDDEQAFVDKIRLVLRESKKPMRQGELLEAATGKGSTDKSSVALLQKFTGIWWQMNTDRNAKLFHL